jgi:hypothetical protein
MAQSTVLDELHLTIRVPADLAARRVNEIRKALTKPRFSARVRQGAREALAHLPAGDRVIVRLSR